MTQPTSTIATHPPLTLSDGKDLFDLLTPVRLDEVHDEVATRAVLYEYRRFLHLAALGPGPTVPSPLIDAVWHLHLADTRAYADWCDKALGRFIHHSPGRAPQADDPAYAQTLARYRDTFGHPPDPRIWPSPAILRVSKWVELTFVIGVISLFIGVMASVPQITAGGVTVAILSFAWLSAYGPLSLGFQTDGGCGGGDGGGCGD